MNSEVHKYIEDRLGKNANLFNAEVINFKANEDTNKKNKILRKIIKPTNNEKELHNEYLKSQLQKNYFK